MSRRDPQRLLIAGRPGQALADRLTQRHAGLEFRIRKLDEVTGEDLAWAEVYLGLRPPLDGSLRELQWVHSLAAGVEPFLEEGAIGPAALLTRTVGRFGERIAEYCAARMLARSQRLFDLHQAQRRHAWHRVEPAWLAGTTATVLGTGHVGGRIATLLRGLGVVARGVSRSGNSAEPFAEVHRTPDLPALAADAEWLIVAVPLTAETTGLIGDAVLKECRGAYLINVARGRVVDEQAMLAALDAGRLSGAALDVFDHEPLPTESPLWDRADVVISPHIAAITSVDEAADGFSEAFQALARGERPAMAVDVARGY